MAQKKPRMTRRTPQEKLIYEETRREQKRRWSQSKHIVRLSKETWEKWEQLRIEEGIITHDEFAKRLLESWDSRTATVRDISPRHIEETIVKTEPELRLPGEDVVSSTHLQTSSVLPTFQIADISGSNAGVSDTTIVQDTCPQHHGETPVKAEPVLRLQDGTVVYSTPLQTDPLVPTFPISDHSEPKDGESKTAPVQNTCPQHHEETHVKTEPALRLEDAAAVYSSQTGSVLPTFSDNSELNAGELKTATVQNTCPHHHEETLVKSEPVLKLEDGAVVYSTPSQTGSVLPTFSASDNSESNEGAMTRCSNCEIKFPWRKPIPETWNQTYKGHGSDQQDTNVTANLFERAQPNDDEAVLKYPVYKARNYLAILNFHFHHIFEVCLPNHQHLGV